MSTVLITGPTSGIGLELTKFFARNHYDMILISRSSEKLRKTKNKLLRINPTIKITLLKADLSRYSNLKRIIGFLEKESPTIDILVNNAGFGTYGPFSETNLQKELSMINVNIGATTILTKYIVKSMIKRGYGKILNVSSTAAFQPGPYMAVYFATKSYVYQLSQALHAELRPYGISVTTLCPGPTATPFIPKAKGCKNALIFRNPLSSRYVAKKGYHGLMSNKSLVIVGLRNRVIVELTRFTPRPIILKITKIMLSKT